MSFSQIFIYFFKCKANFLNLLVNFFYFWQKSINYTFKTLHSLRKRSCRRRSPKSGDNSWCKSAVKPERIVPCEEIVSYRQDDKSVDGEAAQNRQDVDADHFRNRRCSGIFDDRAANERSDSDWSRLFRVLYPFFGENSFSVKNSWKK